MSAEPTVVAFPIAESPSSEGGSQPEDASLVKLFDDLYEFTSRYVGWTDEFRVGAVAWNIGTHVYEQFQSFPYLQMNGPKGHGKTVGEKVLAATAHNPFEYAGATPAVLFRLAHKGVTMFLDELDGVFDPLALLVLRHGFTRGGRIPRCQTVTKNTDDGSESDFRVQWFNCYGPKCLAGQHPLNDSALQTRVISENMARVPMRDTPWPAYIPASMYEDAKPLRQRLHEWAKAVKLTDADFEAAVAAMPDGMDSRTQQTFLPLYVICPARYRPDLDRLVKRHMDYVTREVSDSPDVLVVRALIEMGKPDEFLPGDVADKVNEMMAVGPKDKDAMSARGAAVSLSRMGFEKHGHGRRGNPYRADDGQIDALALDMGVNV